MTKENFEIQYREVAGYQALSASGAAIGRTPDGKIELTFYLDRMRPVSESLIQDADNENIFQPSGIIKTVPERLVLSSVIMTDGVLESLIPLFKDHLNNYDK